MFLRPSLHLGIPAMPSRMRKAPGPARTPNPSPLLNGAITAVCKPFPDLRFLTSMLPVGSDLTKRDERAKQAESSQPAPSGNNLDVFSKAPGPTQRKEATTPGPGQQATQALPGSPAAHSPSVPSLRLSLRSLPLSSSQPQPRRLHGNYVKHKAGNTGKKMPLLWAQQTCDAKKERLLQIEIETWGAQLHPKLLLPLRWRSQSQSTLSYTAYSPLPI